MPAQTLQIMCINKRQHHNPHERIINVGGVANGSRWKMTEADAIRRINYDNWGFYVSVGGRAVSVMVAKHNGREYLKTTADGYAPNNLLSLLECP